LSDALLVIVQRDGARRDVRVTLRIDTAIEVLYHQHGGILPFVLRQLLAGQHGEAVAPPVPGPQPEGQPSTLPAPSLAAQKSDFTAEGSPPPGKVSTAQPERGPDPDPTAR